MDNMNFSNGIYSVLPTPFNEDNTINYDDLGKLIDYQMGHYIRGYVLLGTTSENMTLQQEEKLEIVKFVYDKIKKLYKPYNLYKPHIIVGIGGSNTQDAINQAHLYHSYCTGYMATVPAYNKPTQKGMIAHFTEIANSVEDKPIMIYNIPSRTGVNMEPTTIKYVADTNKNIVGLKQANNDMDQLIELKTLFNKYERKFSIFAGDDKMMLDFYAHGCNGVISILSNIIPKYMYTMHSICSNKYEQYYEYDIFNLCKILFSETNPVPLKYMLYELNIFSNPYVRLPLVELEESTKKNINKYIHANNYLMNVKNRYMAMRSIIEDDKKIDNINNLD